VLAIGRRASLPRMADLPVLLVHGFASSFERNWREPGWVDLLQDEGRQVIGVDLLGHGEAEKPHDPAAYAELEQHILRALPPDGPVDAIGFSLGAQLLLRAAAAHPARFHRVVVGGVGDSVFRDGDPESTARAVETGTTSDGDPAAAQAFGRFARAAGNDPAALAACLRRPTKRLDASELSSLELPVLVVLGDKDFAGPADDLLAALPDARFIGLHGGDHFGTPKDFRFIDAALSFLRA
jgi:pimeloyl-ACP methyl ester carboxylesterase